MSQFKREPKMKTTEPSVDELAHEGMKRGGHAKHKVHKADGGMPMMSRAAPAIARQQPIVRRPAPPLMRKEGGETKAEHKSEMRRIGKVEHELKAHEKKPAHSGHKGLKKGGAVERAVPGGLLPGVTKAHGSGTTGGVRAPGYKGGGNVGPYVNTKVVDDASGHHSKKSTSGGIEGPGYKKGGHSKKHHYASGGGVKAYAQTKMHDDEHGNAVKKKTTGDIELSKFKAGGHVKHSSTHSKHSYGHKAKGGMCKW